MSARATTLVVSAALAVAGTVAERGAGAAEELAEPPAPSVTVRGLTARAVVGSYCVPAPREDQESERQAPSDLCVDSAYPLGPKGRLPVRSRSRVRIDVRTRARAVRAHLVRVRGRSFTSVGPLLTGRALTPDGRYWKVRLPTRLGAATALSIDVIYPDGDANAWAGLRPLGD